MRGLLAVRHNDAMRPDNHPNIIPHARYDCYINISIAVPWSLALSLRPRELAVLKAFGVSHPNAVLSQRLVLVLKRLLQIGADGVEGHDVLRQVDGANSARVERDHSLRRPAGGVVLQVRPACVMGQEGPTSATESGTAAAQYLADAF